MDVGPACRNEMAASEGRPTVRKRQFSYVGSASAPARKRQPQTAALSHVIYIEPQNVEVKNIILLFKKLLRFEIPCSIFDIQK